jgi:hypothetical protein
MTKVARMRDRHKASFQSSYGMSLTYLPFVVSAAECRDRGQQYHSPQRGQHWDRSGARKRADRAGDPAGG